VGELVAIADRHQAAGDLVGAEQRYRVALAGDASDPGAWTGLALICAARGQLAAAVVMARQAVALVPENGRYRSNLGNLLHRQQHYAAALEELDLAVELGDADALLNRALARYESGDLAGSQADFLAAIAATGAQAWASSIAQELAYPVLASGDLRRGFALYEHRWNRLARTPACDLGIPEWQGEDLAGKVLLVYQDMGHGDVLQFCRLIPDVRRAWPTCEIFLAVSRPLVRLFEVQKGEPTIVLDMDDHLAEGIAHYQVAVSSLPARLGIDLEAIRGAPYLTAPFDPLTLPEPADTRLKVGLIWAADQRLTGPRRSVPLELLLPLAEIPGVQLYSLQIGPRAADIGAVGATPLIIDLGWAIRDFADTAGLMSQLDLVVSVDTAPLHLAGGLGVQTVALLDTPRCWRWLRDRQDTPWYDTMALVTQPQPGDWKEVVAELTAMVEAAAAHIPTEPGQIPGNSGEPIPVVYGSPRVPVQIVEFGQTLTNARKKLALPDVTLVMVEDPSRLGEMVIDECLAQADFGNVLVLHPELGSVKAWIEFVWHQLPNYVETSHFLLVQWDSGILDPAMWDEEFLAYDYIGAPWPWHPPPYRVGNGGFSLRSKRLADHLQSHHHALPPPDIHDDDVLCRQYRSWLERQGFRWAPEPLAERFSIEHPGQNLGVPRRTFGYHDCRRWPLIWTREQIEARIAEAPEWVRRNTGFEQLLAHLLTDYVKEGVYTVNEARAALGLGPANG
jgi:tetratricopeptide (TPR) repeat protein